MDRSGERIDELLWRGLRIIQNPRWFCFSLDAVLLAHFASVKKGDRVVDLGTGTGVIPLLLAARVRELNITGLEIIPQVVEMARRSVALNQLGNVVAIVEGDIKDASKILGRGQFNLVVSNPPYVQGDAGRVCSCDIKAAARTEILCNLEDVIREAAGLVNSDGRVAFVHRPSRLAGLMYLMRMYRLEPKRMRLVYPLPGREPNLVLVEGIKNRHSDLMCYSPLYVYKQPGVYSDEMKKIFAGEFLPVEW